jgi:hypothetical protein
MTPAKRIRAVGTGMAFLLALALAVPTAVEACTCLQVPFDTEFNGASHVFSGTSLGSHPAYDSTYPDHHYEIIQLDAVWKGTVSPRMEILVSNSEATCGFNFTEGAHVLVFASAYPDGPLASHLCSRSGTYEPTSPIWQQLGQPLSTSTDARSWGALKSIYR